MFHLINTAYAESAATGATGGPTMGGKAYTGDLPPALAN